jgi:hypothetical protein
MSDKTDPTTPDPAALSKEEQIRVIFDIAHRTMMHHAMWFEEATRRHGREKALQWLDTVLRKSTEVQVGRLSRTLGFEAKEGMPEYLLQLPDQKLAQLTESMAANWLANDGIWFQAIEFSQGMADAKACNDAAWESFSPFEGWSVKRLLNLERHPGLEGLKKALRFRCYGFINKQSFAHETPESFVYRMDDCRVQSARKRKGLDDYPCRSAGETEYREFAKAIDDRIITECITCPPMIHPETYYCAWKFTLRP